MTLLLSPKTDWHTLSLIQSAGLYWINVDKDTDGYELCSHFIHQIPSTQASTLVYTGSNPRTLLRLSHNIALKTLPFFSVTASKRALLSLTNELSLLVRSKENLFILLSTTALWMLFTAEELHAFIQKTKHWAHKYQHSLLVIAHGEDASELNTRLLPCYRHLLGLSYLHRIDNHLEYHLAWWATPTGWVAQQRYRMILNEQGVVLEDANKAIVENQLSYTKGPYFAEKNVHQAGTYLLQDWQLFESNDALTRYAKNLTIGTVIYALYDNHNLESIAKNIYSLRSLNKQLTLVVREMKHGIRSHDTAILLHCGANLIIPFNVSQSKFLMMLDGIQTQRFHGNIPDNIDSFLHSTLAFKQKGVVEKSTFLNEVRTTIVSIHNKQTGVLIALDPRPPFVAKEALAQATFQRMGDIGTVIDGRVFLFLSTCSIGEHEKALYSLFNNTLFTFFYTQLIWYDTNELINKINQLDSYHQEAPSTPPLPEKKSAPPIHTESPQGPKMVRTPFKIDLFKLNRDENEHEQ